MPLHTRDVIPAVGYLRMSSKKQDKSIPAQRVEVERYAAAHGYSIVRWYIDEGISGSESEKREGFQRLMADASKLGDFRVILCWDQDRFSRFDPLEANHYWFILREAGVRIVTVRQGELDLSELGGWLVASINQHGKAQYLKDLSANVLRGRLRKAEKGLWAGSRAPYGYALTPEGKLVLGDPEQIETVKCIFREYAEQDISLRDIAHRLNERGIDSPSGRLWSGGTVQAVLRRPAYLGKAVQFRYSKGKFHTIANGSVTSAAERRQKPVDEWFTVDCPPIIEQALWDRCAAKLKRRQSSTTPNKDARGLLNGLLYCGHCGQKMHATCKPLDSSGDLIYCCATYNSHGTPRNGEPGPRGCYRNIIHQEQVLPLLIDRIQKLVLAPANIDRLKKAIHQHVEATTQTRTADRGRLSTKLAKLDADITAAAAELKRTPDDLYDLAVEDLRALRAKREQAAEALEAAEATQTPEDRRAGDRAKLALAALQRLSESLRDANPAVVRDALHEIIERVELWFDHTHSAKMTRSTFRKGIVTFGLVRSHQSASFMSS